MVDERATETAGDLLDQSAAAIRNHWSRILALPAGICMAVQWHWSTVTLGIACYVLSEVGGWRRSVKLTKLTKDIDSQARENEELRQFFEQTQQDYFDLLRDQLLILANDVFHFGDTERISVYKHDGEAFLMLGRYSKNPDFDKRGRGIYPDDQGCISKAWREGFAFCKPALPEPNGKNGKAAWKERLEQEWGIPKSVSNNFRMKSRAYAALAIEDVESKRRVAVVVIESTRADRLSFSVIQEEFQIREGKRIARFLKKMELVEPSIRYAHEEGY